MAQEKRLEFTVTSDFNLHIEKQSAGDMSMYQRTSASGEYAPLNYKGNYLYNKVIDVDFYGLVYPKHILVVSSVPIEKYEVTMSE